MALSFTLVREIDTSISFSADANPNVTAPSAGALFSIPERIGGQFTDAVSLYIRASNASTKAEVPAATVDFVLWAKDEGASVQKPGPSGIARWTSLKAEAAAPSSGLYTCPMDGKLFVQLTGASLAGSTKLEVWATGRVL